LGEDVTEETIATQAEPLTGTREMRVLGTEMTSEAVEPLIVSPEAGAMVRVLVAVIAPATSITSRLFAGQVWPTQVAPADGRVHVRGAVKARVVMTRWSVISMV
jgi:hypothetical protein